MIDKLITVLSLIYSNTSIIILSGPVRWKKSKKNGQTPSASEKFRSIHRYGFPCNLLSLNKNLTINTNCSVILLVWLSLDCNVVTHKCPLILVSCKPFKLIKHVFVKVFYYSVLFLPLIISKWNSGETILSKLNFLCVFSTLYWKF